MPLITLIFIILIVIAFGILTFFEPKIKGWIGEMRFKNWVDTYLDDNYKYFRNVTLNIDGQTTQIDKIITSKFGIFLVEVKHYKGWIFGTKAIPMDTTIIQKKIRFQNPLRQSFRHIEMLKKITSPELHEHYKSVVVFTSDNCELKNNTAPNVCKGLTAIRHIKSFDQDIISQ